MKYNAQSEDGTVLANKLGIKDQATLDQVEANYSQIREQDCVQQTGSFQPTLSHWQKIHHHLFQDVYEWAGKLRQVDISKGNTRFANWQFVEKEGGKILSAMAKENFKEMSPDQFCKQAAYYYGELNVIHPFREGNGRSQRAYFQSLAQSAGMELNWKKCQGKDIIQGSIAAFHGDYAPLEKIFKDCLVPERTKEVGQEIIKDKSKDTGLDID